MSLYEVPDGKKIRVIMDTDAACEADDPFALVQGLLTEKFIVRAVIAEHFKEEGSVRRSYEIVQKLIDIMDKPVNLMMGEAGPLEDDYEMSAGARFIVEEARREDPHPLYILTMGALSTLGRALREAPEIGEKITAVVIGGYGYGDFTPPVPGFREFNFGNDVEAANIVLSSSAEIWQIPMDAYSKMNIGFAELIRRVASTGDVGKFMLDNMMAFNSSDRAFWTTGECWSLGDSPSVAIAASPGCGIAHMERFRTILADTSYGEVTGDKQIRVYDSVDSRYVLEDLIAKLELFEEENR